MEKQHIAYGLGGLVIGGMFTALVMGMATSSRMEQDRDMMRTDAREQVSDTTESSQGQGMSMEAMNTALVGKTGDAFDKAFIELMIEHHQGAIDMANLINGRAKHDEIKQLGQAIVAAQTKEIKDMQEWAATWGYTAASPEPAGMMEMMH